MKPIVYRLGYLGTYYHPAHEVRLEERVKDRWAIVNFGNCLNKETLEWEYERIPSNRPEDFLRNCRFASAEEAKVFWDGYCATHGPFLPP